MLNLKKFLILSLTVFILFIALISPVILPNVTIAIEDAIIISLFVIIADLVIRFISILEKKELKTKILIQHSQMNTIINNLPFTICFKDLDGKILLANKALGKLLNCSPESLIGRNANEFYVNKKLNQDEENEIIKTKQIIKIERLAEFKGVPPTWCRIMKAPILDTDGNVAHIVVTYFDITEEKELQEKKETFVATLTHDLKTPTISQLRALDLLLKNCLGDLNKDQRELVSQIKNSCSYMYDLIFTILDSYLYDNGQTKIQISQFDMLDLINETIMEISHLLDEKQLNSLIRYQNLNNIEGDRIQIKRVLLNILSNAINHGEANSDIEIELNCSNDNMQINITNQGGIAEDSLQEMFTKFKSTKNTKFKKTSTGLGLYLSKQIIDAHNGKIHVTSKNNVSTFGFSIPIKQGSKNMEEINLSK